jgi:integrase
LSAELDHSGKGLPEASRPLYVWPNPGKLIDRNRRAVNTTVKRWTLHEPAVATHISWDKVKVARDIKDSMKAFIAHEIESQAPTGVGTTYHHLKNFASSIKSVHSAWDLGFEKLEAYLEKLRSRGEAWKFIRVRRWYRWCVQQHIPGFSEETAKRLANLKVQTNPTGVAVRSRDPLKGPFSDYEFRQIRQAVKAGIGTLRERAGVMTLLEIGPRPTQVIQLKERNFKILRGPKDNEFYSLDVPRLKQRVVGEPEYKTRRITPELGRVLEQLITENHQKYWGDDPYLPIFCRVKPPKLSNRSQINSSDLIMPRDSFQKMVVSYARKAGLVSPRTGKVLKTYPTRFRFTFATRHAEQGTPAARIAESLDHSNLHSVKSYTASTSNLVARLNLLEEVEEFTNLIDRFLGKVIERTGKEEQHRLIHGTTPTLKNLGGIGICGANTLCKLMPPLSCYACPKFQAWADGPHEQMLRELEVYERDLENRSGNQSDRISHLLTEVIDAVRALLLKLQGIEPGRKKE